MSNRGDEPAYPIVKDHADDDTMHFVPCGYGCCSAGLTIREAAVIAAMEGMLANPARWIHMQATYGHSHESFIAYEAVHQADALLAELEKPRA